MGLLLVVILALFLPSCAGTNTATANYSRALSVNDIHETRQYGFDVLSGSAKEERASGILALAERIGLSAEHIPEDLHKISLDQKIVDKHGVMLKPLIERFDQYPDKVSLATKLEILKLETRRTNIYEEHGNIKKVNGESLHINVPESAGIERVPEMYMTSHIGRDQQLLDDAKRKVMSVSVVLRKMEGTPEVLLISSSSLTKVECILPKGGCEVSETIAMAALRELVEEAGVKGKVTHKLDAVEVKGKSSEDSDSVWNPFVVTLQKEYGDWPENVRGRMWVPIKDGILLLENMKRGKMADVLRAAQKWHANNGHLNPSKEDEELQKLKLKGLE